MPYDDYLADRVRNVLNDKNVFFEEKKMMGSLTFMVDNKMCVGVIKDTLMARIGTEVYKDALSKKGCKEMDFTGRPLKGYVFIDPEGIDMEEELEYWIQLALDYNPQAKASPRKKKK